MTCGCDERYSSKACGCVICEISSNMAEVATGTIASAKDKTRGAMKNAANFFARRCLNPANKKEIATGWFRMKRKLLKKSP